MLTARISVLELLTSKGNDDTYEDVAKSFRTDRLERELQMV